MVSIYRNYIQANETKLPWHFSPISGRYFPKYRIEVWNPVSRQRQFRGYRKWEEGNQSLNHGSLWTSNQPSLLTMNSTNWHFVFRFSACLCFVIILSNFMLYRYVCATVCVCSVPLIKLHPRLLSLHKKKIKKVHVKFKIYKLYRRDIFHNPVTPCNDE